MKNNKRQFIALVTMFSCLGVGTFNTTTIQAMEVGNMDRIRTILEDLQTLRMNLVGDIFSTNLNQIELFATRSRNLTNLFQNMQRQPNRDAIRNNLRLITDCENALKQFVAPSPLAATVKPNAWPEIDKSLALLRELKELVKAEKY